jgi:hypothetical protein
VEQAVDRILGQFTYNHMVVGYRASPPFADGGSKPTPQTRS